MFISEDKVVRGYKEAKTQGLLASCSATDLLLSSNYAAIDKAASGMRCTRHLHTLDLNYNQLTFMEDLVVSYSSSEDTNSKTKTT